MILVTGASGFVGSALCARLIQDGLPARGAVRSFGSQLVGLETVEVGDITIDTGWLTALEGVWQVVHLAARVHAMKDHSSDALAEYRRINVDGTRNLARQAAAAGVKRFVFLSSIKVNGESTKLGKPFTAGDKTDPNDPYGISKLEAENALLQIASETSLEVVIIRPPLVYGPGAKANFESMMRWLDCGIPLPLGSVTHNRRSMVALDNLIDLIVTCLRHPAAANQTFLVSDGEDLSTADLLRRMGNALGKPARLFYVPTGVLKLGAALLGRQLMYQRLLGSLQVDICHTRRLIDWTPPVSVDEALRRSAEGFHA